MSVLKLATLRPVPALHEDLARRLAVSARHDRRPREGRRGWPPPGSAAR